MIRASAVVLLISIAAAPAILAQSGPDFSGEWKLNPGRSDIGKLPEPPESSLKVDQSASSITVWATNADGAGKSLLYPLDGRTEVRKSGGLSLSTQTKWEGAALMSNTLVGGAGTSYTIMERWKLSPNGKSLIIRRTIVDAKGETESFLVFEAPGAAGLITERPALSVAVPTGATASSTPPKMDDGFVVVSGTRMLLQLKNAVNTKHSVTGDRVYLETTIPVFVNQHLVIPAGSYVVGTITESERAPKGKGRSALNIRFDSITLPNGVTRDFRSRADSVDTAANLDKDEGRLRGEGKSGQNAKTVGTTAAEGAAIGTIVGAAKNAPLTGLGVGAAAGGAAGLIGVLMSRNPDIILHPGTSVEMLLDRDLRFSSDELARSGR